MPKKAFAHVGDNLHDRAGQKIGKITDVIYDHRTLEPRWFVVKVGLLKGHHLVPVGSVSMSGSEVAVPYDKELVQTAPKPEGPVATETEQEALVAHYSVGKSIR
jgi:hypothetical protein